MPGLIPFMLQPSAGSSQRSSGVFQPSHIRQSSLGSSASPVIRPKALRRSSLSSLPGSLPMLPFTHAEWKKAITDIKRIHGARRYRVCATRCSEILDNIKDTTQVEPVYLIYLNFYAALSMEMCAKPLASTSPYQTSLLNQARMHFDRAAELIQAAEESVLHKTRTFSIISSRSSSCHSPSESVSSRAWTADTSPTNSVYSFDEISARPHKPKRTKKVSFSLPQPLEEEPVFRAPEPYIRPDSPTLGFEDDYFYAGAARQELPQLPQPKQVELPLQSEEVPLLPEDDDSMFVTRSVSRYCETLASLKTQLASHAASLHESRRASIYIAPVEEKEDLRVLDRQARIERLRKSGWQRKRFDARRYEELCDAVMAELS